MGKVSTRNPALERFLSLPEFQPELEFLDGRVIQKTSPMLPHSIIQGELLMGLNAFARPRKLGRVFLELRAVFGGSAQVPDLSFHSIDRIPACSRGQEPEILTVPPDITVEILSPGQSVADLWRKIRQCLKHGTQLGWLIDPLRETILVIRPVQKAQILKLGDVLSGDAVLPGFTLPLDEIFGWLDQD